MFDICVKVLQVIRVQRKAVTAIFAFCMLVNALIPSGMRVFNAVQANARQAFENTRAVNGLFSASSVPLETLKDLLTRSNHINTGYSPRSGADPDKDKDTSSSYFLNGFTGAARLFASFNLCPWLVPWAMASGYGSGFRREVFQVHWPPGSGVFVYLLLLSFLVLLSRKSDVPAVALPFRKL